MSLDGWWPAPRFVGEDVDRIRDEVAALMPDVEVRGALYDLGGAIAIGVKMTDGRRTAVRIKDETEPSVIVGRLRLWMAEQRP